MKVILLNFCVFVLSFVNSDPGCGVVPMTQWEGKPSSFKKPLKNPVHWVIIQHTVTPEGNTDQECVHLAKAIRKYHRETLGFHDIGLSFLICGNGKVYEGTGWNLEGAHTRSYNNISVGLSFVGDFETTLPNSRALTAAKDLIACGVTNNHIYSEYKLVGHRQLTHTISPGDALQNEIKTWPHYSAYVDPNP